MYYIIIAIVATISFLARMLFIVINTDWSIEEYSVGDEQPLELITIQSTLVFYMLFGWIGLIASTYVNVLITFIFASVGGYTATYAYCKTIQLVQNYRIQRISRRPELGSVGKVYLASSKVGDYKNIILFIHNKEERMFQAYSSEPLEKDMSVKVIGHTKEYLTVCPTKSSLNVS